MKKYLSVTFFCLLFLSCSQKLPVKNFSIKKSSGEEVFLKLEVADTFETRQKGFMYRKSIPFGTGMLFVFEKDQILSFWMKNTPHPLSIAYINSKGRIIDIFDMTPYSVNSIVSTGYSRYALEVPQGWFEKNGIKRGDFIDLSPLSF